MHSVPPRLALSCRVLQLLLTLVPSLTSSSSSSSSPLYIAFKCIAYYLSLLEIGVRFGVAHYTNDEDRAFSLICSQTVVVACTMDDDLKHLRVSFSGVRQQDHGAGGETIPVPSQQRTSSRRGPMSNAEEYDAAYAATVAAVAYAIAAREEERLLASQERPPYAVADKLARGNGNKQRPAASSSMDDGPARTTPQSSKSPRTPKRGESLKKPIFEGSRSSSSRWFTGKEPIDDDYQDEQANVSVNRPLRPAQKKPAEGAVSDERPPAFTDPAPRVRKDPSFSRKPSEKRGSRRFEQDQGNQTVAAQPTARPMDSKTSSSYSAAGRESGGAATTSGGGVAFSSENEAMADAWEKEKLAKIKKQYDETMQTIAEWESEKKAKARRQKELKDESESDRKRAKALEEYNEEMSRINKVAAASRLTAEEKRRSAERKARDKAHTIRSTGKLPGTCGCF
ncbi:uncharacterized protein [Miscanthus floridulus]|uniref:uncharacterized protein isoform X2 n=1 Tax=Miscanthus floridulus TaxID=154761 RepID=UPI003459D88C